MDKVLIVDDSQVVRTLVKQALSELKVIVVEAENGVQALVKYKEEMPQVVLMDITMPEMDGITCVRQLKAMYPDVKISMLTALGEQEMVLKAIQAGAKKYIVKPFDPERIQQVVQDLLKESVE